MDGKRDKGVTIAGRRSDRSGASRGSAYSTAVASEVRMICDKFPADRHYRCVDGARHRPLGLVRGGENRNEGHIRKRHRNPRRIIGALFIGAFRPGLSASDVPDALHHFFPCSISLPSLHAVRLGRSCRFPGDDGRGRMRSRIGVAGILRPPAPPARSRGTVGGVCPVPLYIGSGHGDQEMEFVKVYLKGFRESFKQEKVRKARRD